MSKKAKKERKEKRQKINDEFHHRVLNSKIEDNEQITTFEDDLKEIEMYEQNKNVKKCEIKLCVNEAMKTTPLCYDCYLKISCDMAKTIKKGDDDPLKLLQ